MSDFVLDASLALQWFLEDEADRNYSLAVLASLSEKRALVPILWFYEVGNGLLMACRRKRITLGQIDGFLARLKARPSHRRRPTNSRRGSRIARLCAVPQPHELRRGLPRTCQTIQSASRYDGCLPAESRSFRGSKNRLASCRMAAKQSKPCQTLIHELLEKSARKVA